MRTGPASALAIGAVATAALVGGSFGPQNPKAGIWYEGLRKPSYTPPGTLVGAAWGVLEVLLCITGYRLLKSRPGFGRTVALSSWAANLAGLAGFPFTFFGRRKLGESLTVSNALFASAASTAATSSRVDSMAAVAATPLVAWTAFATLLSEELWRRNRLKSG